MHSNKQSQIQSTNTQCTNGKRPEQPSVIALRKRCEADGVGLSHYILMDRKPAK